VKQVTGLAADLRWPNDLLLNDKKFCGILTEMNAEPTRVRYVVVGIGVNVNHSALPARLREIATSLRLESGHEWPRLGLVAALLQSLHREYRTLSPATVSSILRRFEQHSSYARGKRVRVEEDGGFEGVTDGLDARGFLRVRTDAGIKTVLSGGVRPLASKN
jgi:BirA family biotin operon repressor/biotin-[acetyl-CoA-carboxylase] ligase